ncbi:MAG: hypothetical protein HYS43_01115 [Candidatus Liptonbacteria bacterium]|nr:hypothetical protein [Candidatus Liptonbacteria bacterium]
MSHLKELGVIFVIPIFLGISGETLRLISLLMHYRNEVEYYSDLFEQFARGDGFAQSVISLLRGDVLERREPLAESKNLRFMVVQRYLAKDDENDWRLFVPHVNPEAVHWRRAEKGIVQIPSVFPHIHNGLHFWDGLGWVGGHFPSAAGEVLVSFNIVDTAMSLVKRADLVKYLFHHQEALWNEMFIRAFGEEEMLRLTRENIVKGWFAI